MHLRLVPTNKEQQDTTDEDSLAKEADVTVKLTDNTKLYTLAVILGVIPLVAYRIGVQHWGYETATHIGFFVGLCCMLCAVGLLYFANWREDLS